MSYYSPNKYPLGSTIDRTIPVHSGYYDRPYYNRYGHSGNYYPPQRGDQWSEYIPVEQRYTEMIPETRVEYRPIEKTYTDYIEVKHETEYQPIPRLEKYIEHIPVERYNEYVDYMPVQKSQVVRTPAPGPAPAESRYGPGPGPGYGYSSYARAGRPYSYGGYGGYGGYSGYGYRYL